MEPAESADAVEQQPADALFKRIGCTFLTILVILFLLACAIYFLTGVSAIIYRFWEAVS